MAKATVSGLTEKVDALAGVVAGLATLMEKHLLSTTAKKAAEKPVAKKAAAETKANHPHSDGNFRATPGKFYINRHGEACPVQVMSNVEGVEWIRYGPGGRIFPASPGKFTGKAAKADSLAPATADTLAPKGRNSKKWAYGPQSDTSAMPAATVSLIRRVMRQVRDGEINKTEARKVFRHAGIQPDGWSFLK